MTTSVVTAVVTDEIDLAEPSELAVLDGVEPISDEDLAELAMAADPDQAIDDDAVPLTQFQGEYGNLLPNWYMPAPAGHGSRRRTAVIATVVIFSLLFINALGLCVTYGRLEVPF